MDIDISGRSDDASKQECTNNIEGVIEMSEIELLKIAGIIFCFWLFLEAVIWALVKFFPDKTIQEEEPDGFVVELMGHFFNAKGTRFYKVGPGNLIEVYALPTPFDISKAVFLKILKRSLPKELRVPAGFEWEFGTDRDWICKICDGGPGNFNNCSCPDGPVKEFFPIHKKKQGAE
jgi:hypothetical protein